MKPNIDKIKAEAISDRINNIPDTGKYGIFTDGIIDINRYEGSKTRVLWMLKEAVGDYSATQYDTQLIQENIDNKSFCKTLEIIAYISYAIHHGIKQWEDIPPLYKGSAEALKDIAIINVKKTMGETTSNDSAIVKAFKINKDIILDQIKTYRPDVIIMGYPEACKEIVKSTIYHFSPDTAVMQHYGDCAYTQGEHWRYIWAYHPSRISSDKKYCEEILKSLAD